MRYGESSVWPDVVLDHQLELLLHGHPQTAVVDAIQSIELLEANLSCGFTLAQNSRTIHRVIELRYLSEELGDEVR